jgi:hypothetical protein
VDEVIPELTDAQKDEKNEAQPADQPPAEEGRNDN